MPVNKKVILCHNGGCLSPRLLVGFNSSANDLPKGVQLSEDVILDYVSDGEAESRLQGSSRCILYMEDGPHSHMCLAHRLDGRLYRQELRERGQELKQLGRPINTPDGQIKWRVLMPGPRLLHVQRLARVLVPHVTQLLADAEAHPGFTKAIPDGEQLHSRLLERNPLIAPNAQGVFICLLSSAGHPVHAILTINMKGACLELSRMDDVRHKSHVAGLQDALDRLPELAATHTPHKPRQPAVYSLHADTCGGFQAPGDATSASVLGPVYQHYTQQQSPLSRVLHGTVRKVNRVAPLGDESSPGPLPQAPHGLQLSSHASVSSTDAAQPAVQCANSASVAAADPLPASPCRSPFARASQEQERESMHIERALELIRVARGPNELWAGLRQLKADRGTARSGWADEWILHEALEAVVIWAANQDGITDVDSAAMGKAVSREAAALVLEASNEGAAARRLVVQMGATLAQRLPSLALLRLFLDLVEIPSVKQAAALGSLAEKLAAHLEALWPVCDVVAALDSDEGHVQHGQPRGAKLGAPRKLSLSQKRRSPSTIGDGDTLERASAPSSPSQCWRESPRPEGVTLAKPGCKPVFVPKLALPALASPKDPGANSRGSRLGLSSQGSGAFAVTPLQRLLSPSFITPDNTFRPPTEQAQDGAYARLTMLGRHVGSGLMAADMAVMLAQKRQESLARAEALAPRLSLPVKTLTAHRIEILTDRSVSDSPVRDEHRDAGQRSAQSSPAKMSPLRASVARRLNMSHTPSSLSAPRAGSPSSGEEAQGQLPSLLMQSLLSARSAASGCKGTPSLAKAVTSQLLALCRGRDSEGSHLRMLCLALLETCTGQWQESRDMLQTSAWRPHHCHAPQHVLFPAIAHELQTACQLYAQGMPLPALERAEKLLGLARQFLERSASPAQASLAEAHLAKPLSQLLALLASMGSFSDWHAAAKGVLDAQLQLSALMLQRCQDGSVASFKSRVFSEAAAAAQAGLRGASEGNVCCSFAHYYTALADLLSRQPGLGQATDDVDPGSDKDEDGLASHAPGARGTEVLLGYASGLGFGTGAALTRRRALSKLAFIVEAPHGVITCMLGQAPPAAGQQASPQIMAALRLLRAVLGSPGNPFVSDWVLVDFFAQFHFLHFARLFHDLPSGGAPLTSLCTAHLQVLKAMASSKSKAVRQQFMQLHVLDMLVRELSLEYEAQQVRPPPVPCLASSTSSSAGDTSAEAASCAASPALSHGGLKIPRLYLSPAPSATAAELRGMAALRLSPAPSGAAKVPPLRLSPAPSGSFLLESRASSAIGQPSRSGSSGEGRRKERAGRLPMQPGTAPIQALALPQKVPALHLPGRLKASKPPLGSSRATPRVQLTARSAAGLMGSARPSSAPLGSARSSPHGPLTPAMPRLERTVSAAAALAQSAESPSKGLGVHGAPHAQRHLLAGQVTPREQLSWRGNPGKVPTSPFAADIVADSRSHSADVLLLQHTSCATVPERSDEADQESSPGEGTPDDAESRRPDLAASQQRSVPPLRLDNLPPESEDESSDSEANSDSEAAAEAPDGGAAGNTSSGVGIELTGDADEDVRRMLALEGYGSDSSSCSSDNGSSVGDGGPEAEQDGTPRTVPALDLKASMRLSQRSSPEHTPVSQADSGSHPGQLGALEKLAQGKGKMQAAQQHSHAPDVAPLLMRSYLDQRAKRLLYADKDLHVLVLETVLELLLTEHGQLDTAYCSLQPLEQRRQNVLYMLGHHLNHPANADVMAPLLARAAKMGPPAVRLLRILCARLFWGDKYLQQKRIARGAYAEVFSCSFTEAARQENVVLKVMDMPRSIHDSCRQVDIFSEIAVLERFKGRSGMCQLLDYGLDGDDFIMVLRHYSGSLKAWRDQMPGSPDGQLRLYLQIFCDIVSSVQALEAEQVVHFDLKCDNILLEPLENFRDPAALPFRAVLSDFGESRMYASAGSALTVRNRGTEYMKSPEMLVVGNATNQTRSKNHDRRRREGAGTPADVWALGCLLYELLTERILFYDPDWIRFFLRLTQSKEDIIPADRMAAVAHLPGIEKLLRCMLVRDPARRATLGDISRRVHKLLEGVARSQRIPEASLPALVAPSRSDSSSMRLQPSGSTASAVGISAQYSLAEHYLDAFTPVAERLLLGSTRGLEQAQRLADHRVSHAIILCCGPEDDGSSSHRRQTHAAYNPEWLQSDTILSAATASCVAADVKCKVIPIGPLPSSQALASNTAEQGLLRAMPAILRLISSALNEHAYCDSPCWDGGGSHAGATTSPRPLPGQTMHQSSAQRAPGSVLLAAAAGYEGEAAVAIIAHIMRQQRLSPYDATLAARYQHSALHLQEHNERQLALWASFAVSPGQAQPH